MTEIRFYHGAADRLMAAAAWLAKAWETRRVVRIYAPDPGVAERLDRQLWIQPATGFIPHCRSNNPLSNETPLIIDDRCAPPRPGEWLLNLSDEVPTGFDAYDGLVEIVSTEDTVKIPARERFRYYREQGHPMQNQDIGQGFNGR